MQAYGLGKLLNIRNRLAQNSIGMMSLVESDAGISIVVQGRAQLVIELVSIRGCR